jgi:hypothetical protein
MKAPIRINGRFFANSYDAGKYLLQLASRGQPVTIAQHQQPALEDLLPRH